MACGGGSPRPRCDARHCEPGYYGLTAHRRRAHSHRGFALIAHSHRPPASKASIVGRLVRAVLAVLGIVLAVLAGLIVLFRFVDPPLTPLMAMDRLSGVPVEQQWARFEDISPRLVRAVIASEDGRFCRHAGIDFAALRDAIDDTRRGNPRGGSTITMQVVKNLFLWPGRSYVRKAIELPLALALDLIWPKRRIIEVYLNIAEWGPGIYGAEAAAQISFGKSAAQLTDAEATRMAVSLPDPVDRDAGDPSVTVERLAARLAVRLRAGVALDCLK
jgi:monofunctional biosynthetic peptidoglycan transglycosylase